MNTLVFDIDNYGTKVSGMDFQKWLRDDLNCAVDDVVGIQQEFGTRRVFVKFKNAETCGLIVAGTNGKGKIKNQDGSKTDVEISLCGLGYREIRIFNVPFETNNEAVNAALAPYGKVLNVRASAYGNDFIFKCDSGVRIARMELQKHVPSYLYIGTGRSRATVVYEGQPRTCAVCNRPGHIRFECPERRPAQERIKTWSKVVETGEAADRNTAVNNNSEENNKAEEQPTKQAGAQQVSPSGGSAMHPVTTHPSAQPSAAIPREVGNLGYTGGFGEVSTPTTLSLTGMTGTVDQERLKDYSKGLLAKLKSQTQETKSGNLMDMDWSLTDSEEETEDKGKKRQAEWELDKKERRNIKRQERQKEKESQRNADKTS